MRKGARGTWRNLRQLTLCWILLCNLVWALWTVEGKLRSGDGGAFCATSDASNFAGLELLCPRSHVLEFCASGMVYRVTTMCIEAFLILHSVVVYQPHPHVLRTKYLWYVVCWSRGSPCPSELNHLGEISSESHESAVFWCKVLHVHAVLALLPKCLQVSRSTPQSGFMIHFWHSQSVDTVAYSAYLGSPLESNHN